jgi:LDH2 family malate/lactate/ureidoglycolate dehydrogenase
VSPDSSTYRLNLPPENFTLVSGDELRALVSRALNVAGLESGLSETLAGLLVGNDFRSAHSHGTWLAATYASDIGDGKLNGTPDVSVSQETPISLVVDGDGGPMSPGRSVIDFGNCAALASDQLLNRSKK